MATPPISSRILFYVVIFLCFIGGVIAQPKIDLKSLKQKYKGDDVVYLNYTDNYVIDIKGDALKIQNSISTEMLFLTDKSGPYAAQQVTYVDFINEINDLEAFTYVPKEKGGYKKVEVKEFKERKNTSESVFYDDVSTKSYIFPQPVEGAIGVTNYIEVLKDPHFLDKFFFATFAPIEQRSVSIKVNKNVNFKYILKNPTNDIILTEVTSGNYITYTWTRKNIAKIKGESQAKSIAYESPHLIIHIASYKGKTKTVKVLENTRDLYNYCYSLLEQGVEKPDKEIIRITDSLTANAKTDLDKLTGIYYYLQQNIKYIAIEDGLGGFIPRKPSLVCSRKYGDCKDIANLLYTMLHYAGISAYHTWIGTTDIPYRFDDEPVMGVANHMIVSAQLNGKWYFLDGTSNFLSYKYPSDFIQGKQAMINITADSFLLLNVPIIKAEDNAVTDTVRIQIANDSIFGNASKTIYGLTRCGIASGLKYASENKHQEVLEKFLELGQNNCKISNIKTTGIKGRDSILIFMYNFKVPKYINQIEDKIYINMNVEKLWNKSEIELETRTREFIFDQTNYHNKVMILDIPKGYKLFKLPNNFKIDNKDFGFEFSYEEKGNVVYYRQKYFYNSLFLNKPDFVKWNETIEYLYKAYMQTIVLTSSEK